MTHTKKPNRKTRRALNEVKRGNLKRYYSHEEVWENVVKSIRNEFKRKANIVATIHFILFIVLVLSPIFLLIHSPWYIALPLIMLIIRMCTSNDICILTQLESKYRVKAGLPAMPSFLKHHVIKPIIKMKRKLKGKNNG